MARGLKPGTTNNSNGRPPGREEVMARGWNTKLIQNLILKYGGIDAFADLLIARAQDPDNKRSDSIDFLRDAFKEDIKAELGKVVQGSHMTIVFSKPIVKREKPKEDA